MSDEPAASTPPPGAEELAAGGVPEGGLAGGTPSRGDSRRRQGHTRGKHLAPCSRNVWVLGLTWVVAIIALIAVGTQAGFGIGAVGAVRRPADRPDRRLADRVKPGCERLLRRLRRGPRADAGLRAVEPATGHRPAPEGRPPLHARSSSTALLPGGLVGRARPLHLRGAVDRLEGQPPDHLLPLHGRGHPAPGDRPVPERAGASAPLGVPVPGLGRGRLPRAPAGRGRERAGRQEVRDLHRQERRDGNRARQVFTPTFIVWLGEEAHEGIAFELIGRRPRRQHQGPPEDRARARRFCEGAAVVARRLLKKRSE